MHKTRNIWHTQLHSMHNISKGNSLLEEKNDLDLDMAPSLCALYAVAADRALPTFAWKC